jgi:hypothetical protein
MFQKVDLFLSPSAKTLRWVRHKKLISIIRPGLASSNGPNWTRSSTYSPYYIQSVFLFVGFEVLTAVVMKSSSVFWDVTPRSLLKVSHRSRGTCRLHLHCQRISQTRNQSESRWQPELGLAYSSTLKMEVTCPSEMSADFRRTTQLYIPEHVTRMSISSFSHKLICSWWEWGWK